MALKAVYNKLISTPAVVQIVTVYDFGTSTEPAIFLSENPPKDADSPCICISQVGADTETVNGLEINSIDVRVDYIIGNNFDGFYSQQAARQIQKALNNAKDLVPAQGEIAAVSASPPLLDFLGDFYCYRSNVDLKIYNTLEV